MINLLELSENVNRYLVRPLNAFGVGGFLFDVEGDTTVNLTTEISDHFLEDNSTIQDHIAIKPKKVVLKSYVGELVYRQDDSTDTIPQKVTQKLTVLTQYLPALATEAQQILDIRKNSITPSLGQDLADGLNSLTVNRAADYWSFVKNLVGQQSRQQQAYIYFKSLMEQKILVSVQTPFEYMSNMAIESIAAIQGEESKFISDFSIVLKQIRTAQILTVPAGATSYVETSLEQPPEEQLQGRVVTQRAEVQKTGYVPGSALEPKQIDSYNANLQRIFSPAQPVGNIP